MIRRQEAQGRRIPDTKAAFDFLSDYAKSSGTKKGGPFADWSPYKITRYHVKLVGVKEIPRPPVNLEGIPGSSRLYQFMGGGRSGDVPCCRVRYGARREREQQ